MRANVTKLGSCDKHPAYSYPGGGGGVLFHISHIGMCRPKRVRILHRFGLKTGIDFAILVCNRVWFSRSAGMYELSSEKER